MERIVSGINPVHRLHLIHFQEDIERNLTGLRKQVRNIFRNDHSLIRAVYQMMTKNHNSGKTLRSCSKIYCWLINLQLRILWCHSPYATAELFDDLKVGFSLWVQLVWGGSVFLLFFFLFILFSVGDYLRDSRLHPIELWWPLKVISWWSEMGPGEGENSLFQRVRYPRTKVN